MSEPPAALKVRSATAPASQATLVGMRQVPAEMAAKLKAASSSFISSFEDVNMNDIAAAVGVSRTSLYYYFVGKDDILSFLLRSMLEELADSATTAAIGPGDALARLRAVVRAQLDHLNSHPTASQLLFANLGRAGKLPDIAARVRDGFHDPVRQLLDEGASEGTLRVLVDPELCATALFGAVLVIGLENLLVNGSIDVERIIATLEQMFWFGLAPLDAPRPEPHL